MGSDLLFNVQVESRNGVARVAAVGELDMGTASALNAALDGVERDGAHAIMLDMRDVAFIDSMGLQAIVEAWVRGRSNGHRMVVVGASAGARRLCRITGTEFILDDPVSTHLLDLFSNGDARSPGE